jgi:hypothetical protein
MTRDDILRMAREANILGPLGYDNPYMNNWRDDVVRELERFAALVAAAEREACARACERVEVNWRKSWHSGSEKFAADAASYCATAIRARGNK